MNDTTNNRFEIIEQTNYKILTVLQSMQEKIDFIIQNTITKKEFNEFRTDVQEQFEHIIENAVTRAELHQAIAPLATKEELLHLFAV